MDVKGLREHEAHVGRREHEAYVGRTALGGPLGQSVVVERLASPAAKGPLVSKARTSRATFSTKWRPTSTTFIANSKSNETDGPNTGRTRYIERRCQETGIGRNF